MFSLKFNKSIYGERDKATYRFMEISFIAVLVIVMISSIGNPTCKYCSLLQLLTIILFVGIVLRKNHFNIIINSYFFILIFIVVLFDFSGFFIHEIISFLYMIVVVFSLLLLSVPINIIYSLFTLVIYSLRTVFVSEISNTDKFILILLAFVGTVSIFYVKDWVVKLYKYKMGSLQNIHNASIKILGKVAEIKDEGTANHLDRVELMMELLCNSLREEKNYKKYIDNRYIHDIKSAAYLHDIGKIGISDKILGMLAGT